MSDVLGELGRMLAERRGADPDSSYVASLYGKGRNKILEKVGEEATEVLLAAKDGDRDALVAETADLWFHTLVMLAELERRLGTSGHTEKAARG